ncbi:MAG: hypothetical protein VKN33_04265 [Candidatus Sericytochromatia bacterium]|nr:hypothetical protein [Candidatus Sericytochromatia bacterium]
MTTGDSRGALRPGDPPPFWEGPWQPTVKPASPSPNSEPSASLPPPNVPDHAPVTERARPVPPPPPPGSPGLVHNLLVHGTPATITALPVAADSSAALALRKQAKQAQTDGQLPQAIALLTEALKYDVRDASLYAQLGHTLMAARVPEDAAHHFLLAYMLAPQDAHIARLSVHAAWALGYVGWAFQIAQALHKIQPAPEWVEIGRAAAVWLKSARPPARSLVCTTCRLTAVVPTETGCPKCKKPGLGAPAQDTALAGLRLLQQNPPTGRLFVGAHCQSCGQDTVVITQTGGLRCLHCQKAPLPSVKMV